MTYIVAGILEPVQEDVSPRSPRLLRIRKRVVEPHWVPVLVLPFAD